MHIVILADPIDNQQAGVYVYTKNLVENLLKIDQKNTYTFIHQRKNNFFNNLNHYIIPRKKILGYGTIRKFYLIPKLIKKLNPDIVFEPCHIGPFRTPKKTKKAVMIHDLTPIKFPHFHIKRSTIIHKLLLKKIIKESDLIITASNTTKNDIKNYQQTKAKIEIISLGINQGPRNTVRPPQKVSQPYLLFVGTIEPRKNLTTLLEAFNELKRETKIPHKLILAGQTGWKSENIIALAKSTKNIELKGYVNEEEKNSLYKNADIFIYPSIYEGFGLPPMEAMNNNVPVITSNTSALKELYGNYSLQFKPKDTQALKTHILTLINNPLIRKNLIKKASAYSKNFTWLNTARKTLNAFEKLQ